MVLTMLLILAMLWPINRNLAVGVSIHMGLFIVFVACVMSILKNFGSDTDIEVSSVIIVMVYSFLLLVPTVKLFRDIPDFFSESWLVQEGEIENVVYRRGYKDVYINDECIAFWDPTTSFESIPDESIVKIYYLPRSKQGLDYKIIDK